jgi:hypothetical protein
VVAVATLRPARLDVRAYRGDDFALGLRFMEDDDTPYDISGWSDIEAQVRSSPDAAALLDFTVVVTDAPQGRLSVLADDLLVDDLPTGCLLCWDLQRVEAGSLRSMIGGRLVVEKDTTHA